MDIEPNDKKPYQCGLQKILCDKKESLTQSLVVVDAKSCQNDELFIARFQEIESKKHKKEKPFYVEGFQVASNKHSFDQSQLCSVENKSCPLNSPVPNRKGMAVFKNVLLFL